MDGFDVFDLVLMIAVLVFLIGLSASSWVRSSVPRLATERARNWLTSEFGAPDHLCLDLVRSQQALVSRYEGFGSLAGLAVTLAVFPPHFDDATSPIPIWCTGWAAGLVVSQLLIAVVLVRRSRPPAGVRVASSAPHRIGDYVSRWGVVLLAAAVIVQIVRIELALRAVGGAARPVTAHTAGAAAVTMILITIAVATILPWLVSRPLHAADDAELDVRIRLRRDRVGFLARMLYPIVFVAGMVISGVGMDQSLDRSSYAEPIWIPPVALAMAIGGYLLQSRFESFKKNGPEAEMSRPFDAPREWQPAPGTNGWILPLRARDRRS